MSQSLLQKNAARNDLKWSKILQKNNKRNPQSVHDDEWVNTEQKEFK